MLVVVDIGESDQFLKELLIRRPAVRKPVAIVKAQITLAINDFELEMWAKPWIVDVEKNSLRVSMVQPTVSVSPQVFPG